MNIIENDQKRTGMTKKSLQPTGVFIGIRLQIFGQLQFDASDAILRYETPGVPIGSEFTQLALIPNEALI